MRTITLTMYFTDIYKCSSETVPDQKIQYEIPEVKQCPILVLQQTSEPQPDNEKETCIHSK